MRHSSKVKPISELNANAAGVLTQIAEKRETMALLKILAKGNQDVASGKVKPVVDVVACLRAKRTSV
jgi:hypothetical protein